MSFSIYLCMEKLIFDYLSHNYYIKESQVGNDGIYNIDPTQIVPTPTNGEKLIKEIYDIFGLDENRSFIAVNDWCLAQKPTANLLFYWKINSERPTTPNHGFQKHYLGNFHPSSKLSRSNFKMSLVQLYVQFYQYR